MGWTSYHASFYKNGKIGRVRQHNELRYGRQQGEI